MSVGLSEPERRWLTVEQRRAAFAKLTAAVEAFEATVASGKVVPTMTQDGVRYRQWDAVQGAYAALRRLYVSRRAKSGWVRGDDGKPKPDPVQLCTWLNERTRFIDAFYGPERADGRRYFDEVPPAIADLIRRYRALWSRWHKKNDRYRENHRRYMRDYMAARRAKAKAAPKQVSP